MIFAAGFVMGAATVVGCIVITACVFWKEVRR
jgi:hypothetical protein